MALPSLLWYGYIVMAVCNAATVTSKHGKSIYAGFVLFGVLLSLLTFHHGLTKVLVLHSHFCSRNTSHGKCDILIGHILLYRLYIGMMLFFVLLAVVNCQVTLFTTFGYWLENGFWLVKFHLFCLCILLAFVIPKGHLSNVIMHVGWIGSFFVMVMQLVLIVDFAKTLNVYWVERMELSTTPNGWYLSLLFITSLLFTLSIAFIVYLYDTYITTKECLTNLVFITVVVILCVAASFTSIHPQVKETGLLQAGIVTSYSVYLMWTSLLHYPFPACNPTWNYFVVTEFKFHLQPNILIDMSVTLALLVYSIWRVSTIQDLLTNVSLTGCCIASYENEEQGPEVDEEQQLLVSGYLMFYIFLVLVCLHLLMTISNFYTSEGIVGTDDEMIESDYQLVDMDEYVKSLSQWVASCLKATVCIFFLFLYMWTILAPLILPSFYHVGFRN